MEPTEEVIENEIEQKSIERTVIEERGDYKSPRTAENQGFSEPEPEPEPQLETDREFSKKTFSGVPPENRSRAPNPNKNDEVAFDKPKRRTKKERSPAQIAAFEKARLKRMEIANQKKQIKAKQKEEDNILKEQIKARLDRDRSKAPNPNKNDIVAFDNEPKSIEEPKPILKKEVVKPRIEQPKPREIVREQVVNNYYYYGEEQPKRRGRKKKIVEPESETESESEEEYIQQPSRSQERMFRPETPPSPIQQPETYKELQSYKEEAPKKQVVRAQPKLKFSFV